MDVKTAFLNGILEHEVYMDDLIGVKSDKNQVCKLHKSLYGWNKPPDAGIPFFIKFHKVHRIGI